MMGKIFGTRRGEPTMKIYLDFERNNYKTIPVSENTTAEEVCNIMQAKIHSRKMDGRGNPKRCNYFICLAIKGTTGQVYRRLGKHERPSKIMNDSPNKAMLAFILSSEDQDDSDSDSDSENQAGDFAKDGSIRNLMGTDFDSSDCERKGVLLKRGAINKAFKERQFILQKGHLVYYREDKSSKSKNLNYIFLAHASVRRADESRHGRFSFEIQTPARIYILQAKSEFDMGGWMQAISNQSSLSTENKMITDYNHKIITFERKISQYDEEIVSDCLRCDTLLDIPEARDILLYEVPKVVRTLYQNILIFQGFTREDGDIEDLIRIVETIESYLRFHLSHFEREETETASTTTATRESGLANTDTEISNANDDVSDTTANLSTMSNGRTVPEDKFWLNEGAILNHIIEKETFRNICHRCQELVKRARANPEIHKSLNVEEDIDHLDRPRSSVIIDESKGEDAEKNGGRTGPRDPSDLQASFFDADMFDQLLEILKKFIKDCLFNDFINNPKNKQRVLKIPSLRMNHDVQFVLGDLHF